MAAAAETRSFTGLVLLLAVAIWIVSPVVPAAAQMLLWAALLIGSATFLRAIDSLPSDASGYARLWKGVGLMALGAGLAILVGALAGSREGAGAVNAPLLRWRKTLFVEANPTPANWAFCAMGLIPSGIRLPLTMLSERHHETVRQALKQAGVHC